jgi:hypothetical protein
MTDVERITQLETEIAALRERLTVLEHHPRIMSYAAQGFLGGLDTQERLQRARMTALLPLIALMGTRIAALEERLYSPEEAAQAHEYWARALQQIGISPDPLKLSLE